MQCVVVEGNFEAREVFLSEFVKKHDLPPYSIIRFSEKIKIADARRIISLLAQRLGNGEKRVIVLAAPLTLDAQNALLKALEEIPESTFVLFLTSRKEELLPTILSRCQIVRLPQKNPENKKIDSYQEILIRFFDAPSLSSALYLSEKISLDTEENIESCLRAIRTLLLSKIDSGSISETLRITTVLSLFLRNYSTLIQNNVNKKFFLENLLLDLI